MTPPPSFQPKNSGLGLPQIRSQFASYVKSCSKFWSRDSEGRPTLDLMKAALVGTFVAGVWFLEKAVQNVVRYRVAI